MRVGVYTSIRPDCTSGPLPAIRLATAPAHGTVSVKRATLKATNFKQCLAIDVPAFVAFYRAAQDFTGADQFELEITFAGGRKEIQHFQVSVSSVQTAAKASEQSDPCRFSKHQLELILRKCPNARSLEKLHGKYVQNKFRLICCAAADVADAPSSKLRRLQLDDGVASPGAESKLSTGGERIELVADRFRRPFRASGTWVSPTQTGPNRAACRRRYKHLDFTAEIRRQLRVARHRMPRA